MRPSIAHLILTGEAALLGAATATAALLTSAICRPAGEEPVDAAAAWSASFRANTSAAAAAVTPIGAYVLRSHVFTEIEA